MNVVDVYQDIREQQRKRKTVYAQILLRCQAKIRGAVTHGMTQCFFHVAEFQLGLPTFNVEECTQFLKKELEEGGFHLTDVTHDSMLISWDIKHLEAMSGAPPPTEDPKKQKKPPVASSMDKLAISGDVRDELMVMSERRPASKAAAASVPRRDFILRLE
jgi:hypothetical protein